jgi:thiamine-phosphate pyrophosphorylase
MILGGTVNNMDDAHRAAASGVLDYVGVGPWRFTANKKNLSPILAQEGVAGVLQHLAGLPAWVIGGIEAEDLAAVRATGAAGVAVSSVLYRDGAIEKNVRQLRAAWEAAASTRQLITTL